MELCIPTGETLGVSGLREVWVLFICCCMWGYFSRNMNDQQGFRVNLQQLRVNTKVRRRGWWKLLLKKKKGDSFLVGIME